MLDIWLNYDRDFILNTRLSTAAKILSNRIAYKFAHLLPQCGSWTPDGAVASHVSQCYGAPSAGSMAWRCPLMMAYFPPLATYLTSHVHSAPVMVVTVDAESLKMRHDIRRCVILQLRCDIAGPNCYLLIYLLTYLFSVFLCWLCLLLVCEFHIDIKWIN